MKKQVLQNHIVLVGNGRLAAQLKAYLDHSNDGRSIVFSHVYRSKNTPKEIAKTIESATHIWLAISDQAIEEFYTQYCRSMTQTWVHFSGAHNSEFIFSAHPLMTFTENPMPHEEFEKIHFTVSLPKKWNSEKSIFLADLIPGSRNPWSLLEPEQKALYHAWCVMAGNFPLILWSEAIKQFQLLNIPDQALFSYLDRTLSNFKTYGPEALTGPMIRNDLSTIRENIHSLGDHPFKKIYESFAKAKGINL